MKRLLVISGPPTARTCISEDGKVRCPHLLVSRMGTIWSCRLFSSDLALVDEHGEPGGPGRLQRWPECIAAEAPTCQTCEYRLKNFMFRGYTCNHVDGLSGTVYPKDFCSYWHALPAGKKKK